MGENHIAEACLCNSGIASGNLMLNQQKNMIDQFYRTASAGFGNAFKRDASSSSDNVSKEEDEEEEEEEEEKY